jgi:hypothetical protein
MTIKRSMFRSLLPLFVLVALAGTLVGKCVTLDDITTAISSLPGGSYKTDVSVMKALLKSAPLQIQAIDGKPLGDKLGDDDTKVFDILSADSVNWEAFGYREASDEDRQRLVKQVQDLVDLGDIIVVAQQPPKGHVALIVARSTSPATSATATWKTVKILFRGTKNTDPPQKTLMSDKFDDADGKTIDFFRCRQ